MPVQLNANELSFYLLSDPSGHVLVSQLIHKVEVSATKNIFKINGSSTPVLSDSQKNVKIKILEFLGILESSSNHEQIWEKFSVQWECWIADIFIPIYPFI